MMTVTDQQRSMNNNSVSGGLKFVRYDTMQSNFGIKNEYGSVG